MFALTERNPFRSLELELQWSEAGSLMGSIAIWLFLRLATSAPPVSTGSQINNGGLLISNDRFVHEYSIAQRYRLAPKANF